ncbi:hypothetical protein L2E82_06362 [Cichorium intybus]|uniref:Uncharacterized protein n=1 Tax=Cichorium intybus TaxID=13427 RepID=A0ACB9HAA7_CICIN|nr:hypothetical protein L2E82_06362 [Cichorium intybus]
MAGGPGIGSGNGKAYPGKLTFNVFITCMVAACGGLIFGYDIGISGGVTSMAPFLKQFFPAVYEKESEIVPSSNQYCKFNSTTLTMFTSSLYLAALVASWFASVITRSWGRKMSMLIGGLTFCAGALLNAFAQNVLMLIIGRILLGIGIGFANQSVPLYLSEMAPYKYRGALNMMFQLSITIGILIANAANYGFAQIKGGWGWRLSLGGAVTMGFGDNASLFSALITGIVNSLATFVSILTVDKFGRRVLFLEGGFQMLICQAIITIAIALKFGLQGNPGQLEMWYSVLVVVAICIYIAGFAWSWGPLGWLVPSEIFPLEIRSAAQSVNVSVNMIFTFFIAQIFLQMLCALRFGLFIFFMFWVAVMTFFIYKYLPETKGIPIEEMAGVWKEHPYWKRFVTVADDEENGDKEEEKEKEKEKTVV